MPFKHTDDTMTRASEPPIEEVHTDRLPQIAFAEPGKVRRVSTWKYPHHFVHGPRNRGADGRYIDGTLMLHLDMLWHAWHAAQKDKHVKAFKHLQAHRANMVPDPVDRPHGKCVPGVERRAR